MRLQRWTNPSLPQTLQIGMFLLYIDAALGLLFGGIVQFPIGTAVVIGSAIAAVGIANEYKWAYVLGVIVSALALVPFAIYVAVNGIGALFSVAVLFSLIFPVVQFVALVHPQSRDYQRTWFS